MMAGRSPTLDINSVFVGLAGTDAGWICVRLPDRSIRRATRGEAALACMAMPRLRYLRPIGDGRPPASGGGRRHG